MQKKAPTITMTNIQSNKGANDPEINAHTGAAQVPQATTRIRSR